MFRSLKTLSQKLIDRVITPLNFARLCWVFTSAAWNAVFSSIKGAESMVMRGWFLGELVPKVAGTGSVVLYLTRIGLTTFTIIGAEKPFHTFKSSLPMLYNDVMWSGLNLVTANHFVLELFGLAEKIILNQTGVVSLIFAGYLCVDLVLGIHFYRKGLKADRQMQGEIDFFREKIDDIESNSLAAHHQLQAEADCAKMQTTLNSIHINRKIDLANGFVFAGSVLLSLLSPPIGWTMTAACMYLLLGILMSQRKHAKNWSRLKHEVEDLLVDDLYPEIHEMVHSPGSVLTETLYDELDDSLDEDFENADLLVKMTGIIEYATTPPHPTTAELLLFGHDHRYPFRSSQNTLLEPLLAAANPLFTAANEEQQDSRQKSGFRH